MASMHYELKELTDEEASQIRQRNSERKEAIERATRDIEMAKRAAQIERCMSSEAIELGDGNSLWSSVTSLLGGHCDAYSGCGLATAYIIDGKLIAWHYGDAAPDNAPKNCRAIPCEVSCCQLLIK